MQLQGVIKEIKETEQKGNFVFRMLILSTAEQYSQDIAIQFNKDATEMLNLYKVGESITVSINIRGKGYEDRNTGEMKYFNTIQGWKIERN